MDDDQSFRRALESLLRSAGFQVAAFASAEEFLGSGGREPVGCAIVDLRMPGMDGLELQQRLLAAGRPVPTIIVTAHEDREAKERALRAGAKAFLRKPFEAETLLGVVEAALRGGSRTVSEES